MMALLVVWLAAQADAAPPRATPARRLGPVPGLENVAEVAPGIYRGSAPAVAGLDSLKKLGIRTVVNLRHYHGTTEEQGCRERGIDYVRVVLESSDAPRDDDVRFFLRVVTDPARQPVYVLTVGHRVARLLADPDRLAAMSRAARWLGRPHAAREVAEQLGRLAAIRFEP